MNKHSRTIEKFEFGKRCSCVAAEKEYVRLLLGETVGVGFALWLTVGVAIARRLTAPYCFFYNVLLVCIVLIMLSSPFKAASTNIWAPAADDSADVTHALNTGTNDGISTQLSLVPPPPRFIKSKKRKGGKSMKVRQTGAPQKEEVSNMHVSGVCHADEKPTALMRAWVRIDHKGESSIVHADKLSLSAQLGIQARDLRLLESTLANQTSVILCRERAILINMAFVKAIITTAAVYIVSPDDPLSIGFMNELKQRLQAPSDTYRSVNRLTGDSPTHSARAATTLYCSHLNRFALSKSSPRSLLQPLALSCGCCRPDTTTTTVLASAKANRLYPSFPSCTGFALPGQHVQLVGGSDGEPRPLPFELRVLEICLDELVCDVDDRTTQLEDIAYPAVEAMADRVCVYVCVCVHVHVVGRVVGWVGIGFSNRSGWEILCGRMRGGWQGWRRFDRFLEAIHPTSSNPPNICNLSPHCQPPSSAFITILPYSTVQTHTHSHAHAHTQASLHIPPPTHPTHTPQVQPSLLDRVRRIKTRLSALFKVAETFREVLEELLDDDKDM